MKLGKTTRALITGASSGIGEAIARRLAELGVELIITGRDPQRLGRTLTQLGPKAKAIPADLTKPEDRQRLIAAAQESFGRLDLLVNCAGVGAYGHFDTHDEKLLRDIFEINFFSMAELTRSAQFLLQKGVSPTVVNMGSIVARRGLPARLEYSASKFAVAAFTESLRSEWVRYGIHVMMINPGFTQTPFETHLLADTAVMKTQNWRSMTPQAVANAFVKAVEKQRNEVTLTLRGKALLLVNRLLPRFVDWGMARLTFKLYPDSPALEKK